MEYSWEDCIAKARTINDHYAMTEEDQKIIFDTLKDIAPGSMIVELGTAHGKTSAILAYIAKHQGAEYHGVDNFSLEGSADEVNFTLDSLDLPHTLHEANTHDLPWSRPIDALLIDAGHDEANIKPDCEKWIPFVNPGGYVIFDDWTEGGTPATNAHWAIPYYGNLHTIGWKVIVKPSNGEVLKMMIKQKPL